MKFASLSLLCAIGATLIANGINAAEEFKLSFCGTRTSNYKRNTAINTATEQGDDFVVYCTRTAACETAWGIFSDKIPVPKGGKSYVYSFEICADEDWKDPDTSLEVWDNVINWYKEDGTAFSRRRLSLEFRKGGFERFCFVGKIPQGSTSVCVRFGIDNPDILPGKCVRVRNARLSFYRENEKLPREGVPDLLAPLVKSLFKSPSRDCNLTVRYQILDDSQVDWQTLAVTDAVRKVAIPFSRDGNIVTLAPQSPWKNGQYWIDVAVSDTIGNRTVSRKVFFIGEEPPPARVRLRDDAVTLVDGKEFFPIGIYAVSPCDFNGNDFGKALKDLKTAGVNCVHSYANRYDPELFKAATTNDMFVWTTAHGAYQKDKGWFVNTGRLERCVLAWYIGDDTSMYLKPGQLYDRDEGVKMIDASRITCQADTVRASAAKSNYQLYLNYSDVFMPELYPIDGTKDERCVADVCLGMDRCRDDIEKFGDGRPRAIWPILQCFHGNSWKRYPTAAEMYAMSFAALIHGGRGITWFKYGGEIGENGARYSGMFRTPEDWAAMTNITRRISLLAPVLLERTPRQPNPPEIIEGPKQDGHAQPSVSLLLKYHSSGTYILAVNACAQKVKARFDLRDFCLPSAYAKVAWEKRRLKLDRGLLVDDFPPFGVHVYRFDPEKGGKRK